MCVPSAVTNRPRPCVYSQSPRVHPFHPALNRHGHAPTQAVGCCFGAAGAGWILKLNARFWTRARRGTGCSRRPPLIQRQAGRARGHPDDRPAAAWHQSRGPRPAQALIHSQPCRHPGPRSWASRARCGCVGLVSPSLHVDSLSGHMATSTHQAPNSQTPNPSSTVQHHFNPNK